MVIDIILVLVKKNSPLALFSSLDIFNLALILEERETAQEPVGKLQVDLNNSTFVDVLLFISRLLDDVPQNIPVSAQQQDIFVAELSSLANAALFVINLLLDEVVDVNANEDASLLVGLFTGEYFLKLLKWFTPFLFKNTIDFLLGLQNFLGAGWVG